MIKATSEKREVRKLQVTGGSTYILSLPKKWVAEMNLEKGSQITLLKQKDGSILITPEETKKPPKPADAIIEVLSNEDSNSIIRKIVSTYLVGYNVVYIRGKNQRLTATNRNAIKTFVRRMLVGTEIIADSPSEIVIKVLLSYPELSIQSALRRMCIITSSMHKDTVTALKGLDKELAYDVITMDDEVDRFSLYIIRQLKAAVQNEKILQEIGLSSGRDCLGYRLITKAVERTADHALEIAENVSSLKKPLRPKIFELVNSMSSSAISVFEDAIEALFKRNYNLAEKTVLKAKKVASSEKDLIEPVLKMADVEEASSLRLMIESIRRTAGYASDIAEIVLNMTIHNTIKE